MFAPAFWYAPRPGLAAMALWPWAVAYAGAARLHGRLRARRAYYAGVPVISVGNLVVGGAGKTPVVQWLAAHYAAQGHQVAVLSRGYGSQATYPQQVNPHTHSAAQVGDEPLALARALAGHAVVVWVGRNRPAVARRAEQSGATLLILDDGFQRRDVARSCDILVLNGLSPWGNGLPLPAGPLREPLSARRRAHFAIVINEPAPTGKPRPTLPYYGLPAYRLTTRLAPASVAALRGKPLLAFAGLAHPDKFMRSLAAEGLILAAAIAFPDHHPYSAANLTYLRQRAAESKATLVTTSKDAARLPPNFAQVAELELTGAQQTDILTEIDEYLAAV